MENLSSALKNLPLKSKLLTMVIIPLVLMTLFAIALSYSAWSDKRAYERMQVLANFAVISSNLVHELQKERGMTAGFIGSKGEKFGPQLQKQRTEVDSKLTATLQAMQSVNNGNLNEQFASKLKTVSAELAQINDKRALVDGYKLSLPDALKYYTNINSIFLSLVSDLAKISNDPSLTTLTAAYANFLQSKERAGIERAVLSNVFGKNEFGPLYNRFLNLVNTQQNYLNVFLSLAPQDIKAFYQQAINNSAFAEVEVMRSVALDKAVTGNFGIDPTVWFQTQTKKINVLKDIENHIETILLQRVKDAAFTSALSFYLELALAIAGIIITLLFSLFITRLIREQIGGEPQAIQKITESLASGNISTIQGNHEQPTGIYKSIIILQQQISDTLNKDINSIVRNAKEGNLDTRIDLSKKEGFYKDLSQSINELVEACDAIVTDTSEVMQAVSRGDLTKEITRDYHGSFDTLKQNINLTTQQIKAVIEHDVQEVVQAAVDGKLYSRIDTENKEGFFLDLCNEVNNLLHNVEDVFSDIDNVMGNLSQGDLTLKIDKDYQGTYADIKHNTNATVDKLTEIIDQIKRASSEVAVSASEIEQGTNDLGKRTEIQASDLEETSSTMEEMTSSVSNTARNTQEAESQSKVAMSKALHGGEVIQEAISAMNDINEGSSQIANIVGVIDEIAFQTNLLALNAAVEAARAGEQGRGFAVVASEVRELAQRSASSAKEIKELINNSLEKVVVGKSQVALSEDALTQIISSVETVSTTINNISSAAAEQSKGITQVNTAISSVDTMTQQNSALVEQATAASMNMRLKADELNQLVNYFKIHQSPPRLSKPKLALV